MASTEPALVWSKTATHCVVCARPFATAHDAARHSDDCDGTHWCTQLCWVNEGGDCTGDIDELSLWLRVRAAEEAAAAVTAARSGTVQLVDVVVQELLAAASDVQGPLPGQVPVTYRATVEDVTETASRIVARLAST